MERRKKNLMKESVGLLPPKSGVHIAVLMIQKKYFLREVMLKNSGIVGTAGAIFNFLSAPPAAGQSAVRKILFI